MRSNKRDQSLVNRQMLNRYLQALSVTGVLLTLLLSRSTSLCQADSPPSNITLNNLEGKPVTPLKSENGKPSVIIFITTDCPIANALAPEINRIYKEFHPQGIELTLVHVDPDLSAINAKQHAADYSLKPPIVIDRKHLLVKKSKASVTPQTAVFDGKGKLVYTGRLNNQWVDYGKRRAKPSEHNLRETLDALLAGKPAPKSHTTAVGCYIPDLD